LCAQLTRDLFAIAKFLLLVKTEISEITLPALYSSGYDSDRRNKV